MRWLALLSFGSVCLSVGCSADLAPALPDCPPSLPAASVAVKDASGASVCVEPGATASIASTGDLNVIGYTAIGKAFTVTQGGMAPLGVAAVLPVDDSKIAGVLGQKVVVLLKRGNAPAHAAMVADIFVEPGRGKIHLRLPEAPNGPVTLQAALPTGAGTKTTRHHTYRALAGVSMGGFGASVNFWKHPDRYDAIAVLGADPGPDMTYTLGMVRDYFAGGFCTAADGANAIGTLCPSPRAPLTAQYERASSFEAMLYEAGSGTGLTLKRSLYMRAVRDLSRAMGNVATYNPSSKYLPPGVPPEFLAKTPADACANPIVLHNFYDKRYNPDGKLAVITFCDGNDSDTLGLGKLDPSIAATDPPQVLLAVDVNGNGKRDSGEPIIVQHEPWQDVGADGMASKDEPGYDPVTNPDPSGDDFHYLWNPMGTEGNWRYDMGEPYEDVGIDGVAAGCPAGSAPGCWDYGSGNGKFDYTPDQDNWRAHDPRTNLEALSAADLSRLDVYYDAGIRDFFNAQVSTNALLGVLTAHGLPVRAYDGFPTLMQLGLDKESTVNINKVDVQSLGSGLFVRYGNPALPASVYEASGDGRHAGEGSQVIHRAQLLFAWLNYRWANGDRVIAPVESGKSRIEGTLTMKNGRSTPYVVTLPPGYFQPENAAKTYPVVYLGHGYGMDPAGIGTVGAISQNLMSDDSVPEAKRLQKMIVIAIDAACRPGGDVKSGPLPLDGDLCEEGGFYVDHPDGTYLGESLIEEMEAEIASKYRARPPADETN